MNEHPTFTTTRCYVCGKVALTYGAPDARLCRRCWPLTLAWAVTDERLRWLVAQAFNLIERAITERRETTTVE